MLVPVYVCLYNNLPSIHTFSIDLPYFHCDPTGFTSASNVWERKRGDEQPTKNYLKARRRDLVLSKLQALFDFPVQKSKRVRQFCN